MAPVSLDSPAAGLLLHPTSLASPFGSGDLGPDAFAFADALHDAALRWWQMLPITPPGAAPEFSPYSSYSAFAGSPWLVSPQLLYKQGLISSRDLADARQPIRERIDFPRFRRGRSVLLRKAFANAAALSTADRRDLEQFSSENQSWLQDWALYAAVKESRGGESWLRWPSDIRLRRPAALEKSQRALAADIDFHKFVQWLFDRQWTALKSYCNRRHIGLIGDIPIFVAQDSADVWANPNLFLLDSNGSPTVVSGYPPDPFSPLGQRWGHPHYRWTAHIDQQFAWWIARFGRTLRQFDAVRIDHFLGFHRVWAVPVAAKNAIRGKWTAVPGEQLFSAVRRHFGKLPVIAEDLGKQTAQALALRDKFKFPGMKLLQFSFGGKNYRAADLFPENCVAYTGTHDNQTLVGWLATLGASRNGELSRALAYAGAATADSHWNFIRALFASPARTVIVPVQDVLGLGAEHRMNVPGVLCGNWGWRMTGPIPRSILLRLRQLCQATGRAGIQRKSPNDRPKTIVPLKRRRRIPATL
jgi:4-alpha-glucanotransferase